MPIMKNVHLISVQSWTYLFSYKVDNSRFIRYVTFRWGRDNTREELITGIGGVI